MRHTHTDGINECYICDHAWSDEDVITFGKYGDGKTQIKDVPASYLLWLWNNGMWRETLSNRIDPCRCYIIKNIHHLETEATDTIIEHKHETWTSW